VRSWGDMVVGGKSHRSVYQFVQLWFWMEGALFLYRDRGRR
jgi:hypothetical protein